MFWLCHVAFSILTGRSPKAFHFLLQYPFPFLLVYFKTHLSRHGHSTCRSNTKSKYLQWKKVKVKYEYFFMLITRSSAPLNWCPCTQCVVCAASSANAHTDAPSTPTNPTVSLTKQVSLTQSCEWRETPERVWEREKEREWQQPHLTHHIHLDGENRLYLRTTRWGISTPRIGSICRWLMREGPDKDKAF